MKSLKWTGLLAMLCSAGLVCSALLPRREPAAAQAPPRETVGMAATVRGAVALEDFPDELAGGELRMREVVLEPGAKIARHVHDTRPSVAYVVEGELIEHRSDSEVPLIRRAGDAYFEAYGLVHWVENTSPRRVRVISVDIVPDEGAD